MSSIHQRDFPLKHLAISKVLLCFKVFLSCAPCPISTQIWTEIFLEQATISLTKPMLTLQCCQCVIWAISFESLTLIFYIFRKSFYGKECNIFHIPSEINNILLA